MRKIILFNMMTLDGYFEGPNHSLDWHNVDAEFNDFAQDQLHSVDMLIFGRKTYDLMVSYWMTSAALSDDPVIANLMNTKPKIVFSKTMAKAEWNNTRLISENIKEEIEKLKQSVGKDLIIMGSANLASTFQQLDLIDEYRIFINPIVLGQGTPLFRQPSERLNLKLIKTKAFNSGNVLLYYEPKRNTKMNH
jgi:dihydrofolate reductase